MAETASLTLELPARLKQQLDSLAADAELLAEELATEAIVRYIALAHQADAETLAGLADADAGDTVNADLVHAWLRSWGTRGELPPPT